MGRLFDKEANKTSTTSQNVKKGRLFAEPITVRAPTLGDKVVDFGKDLAKDAVGTVLIKPAARVTEAVTKTVFPNSLAAEGYKIQADEGKGEDFNIPVLGNYNVSTVKGGSEGIKQIAGETLHSAAYLAPYGKIAGATGGRLLGASKLTPSAVKTAEIGGEAIASGLGGAAFGAGTALEEGLSTKDVLTQGALGAGLGVVAPIAIRGVAKGLGIGKSVEKDIAKYNKKNVPEVTPTEIPTRVEPPTQTASIPKSIPSTPAKLPLPENTAKINEYTSVLDNNFPEEFGAKTHKEYADSFAQDFATDPVLAEKYATGAIKHPKGSAYNDAYNALLSNEAVKKGDLKMIDRLSNTDVKVSSISGQKLEANKLRTEEGDVINIIKEIKQEREKLIPDNVLKKKDTEVTSLHKDLMKTIEEFKGRIPTKEDILSAVERLKC